MKMNPVFGFFIMIALVAYSGAASGTSGIKSFFIASTQTDPAINRFNADSNYVALDTTRPHIGKLCVLLSGSYSRPRAYRLFMNMAAREGFHVTGLVYPDDHSILVCDYVENEKCYDNMRREVVYGTPVSDQVSVDSANCIMHRLRSLLEYLAAKEPLDGWNLFILGGRMRTDLMVFVGHSQGAGHAAYIANDNPVDRVIMFSGLDDYSECGRGPAPWTVHADIAHTTVCAGLLHVHDEVKPFEHQCAVWRALHLTVPGGPVCIDTAAQPFSSLMLCTSCRPRDGKSFHNSTIVDRYTPMTGTKPALLPVWRFLLTGSVDTVRSVPRNLPDKIIAVVKSWSGHGKNEEVVSSGCRAEKELPQGKQAE